jgi:hypothetical protein
MKRLIFLMTLFVLLPSTILAQGTNKSRHPLYRSWISLNNSYVVKEGILYEVNDSTISLNNIYLQTNSDKLNLAMINCRNIKDIYLRPQNSILKGAVFGAVVGIGIGVIIGLTYEKNPNTIYSLEKKDVVILNGSTLGLAGAGVGTLLGSIKIRIPINGRIEKYNESRGRLKSYSQLK